MLTVAQAAREALKTVTNPDDASIKRLVVIAQSKLDQEKSEFTIQPHNVSQARSKIRKYYGPLTHAKIEQYEREHLGIYPSKNGHAKMASSSTFKTAPNHLENFPVEALCAGPDLDDMVEQFNLAKTLVTAAGSEKRAHELIAAVKGLK